ncbi:MAG: hypothetical protein GF355_09550 [Candidatus Eisenbacteria bacterium]|nr:hypothetical protein [Candidatus Eisenbacteria bacterium]
MGYVDVDSLPKFEPGGVVDTAELDAWFTALADALDGLTARNLTVPFVYEGTIDLDDTTPGIIVNHGIKNAHNLLQDMISATENGVPVDDLSEDSAAPLQQLMDYVYETLGGGTIYLPSGHYYLKTENHSSVYDDNHPSRTRLEVPPKVHLMGAGAGKTVLVMSQVGPSGGTQDVLLAMLGEIPENNTGVNSPGSAGSLRDMTLQDSTTNAGDVTILVHGRGRYGLIIGVEAIGKPIQYAAADGNTTRAFQINNWDDFTYWALNWIVENCTARNCQWLFSIRNQTQFHNFIDTVAYRCGGGIQMLAADHFIISGMRVFSRFPDADVEEEAAVEIYYHATSGYGSGQIILTGCVFRDRCRTAPVISWEASRGVITNCSITESAEAQSDRALKAIGVGVRVIPHPSNLIVAIGMNQIEVVSGLGPGVDGERRAIYITGASSNPTPYYAFCNIAMNEMAVTSGTGWEEVEVVDNAPTGQVDEYANQKWTSD